MSFKEFGSAVRTRFDEMAEGELFEVACDRDELWDTYLASFPEGTNPMFRERTEHDCSCCKSFVRNVAHIVSFDANGDIQTIWDIDGSKVEARHAAVAQAMAEHVRALAIDTIFRTPMGTFGAEVTREMIDGKVKEWHHFSAKMPRSVVSIAAASQQSKARSAVGVFERGLRELSMDALETVLDLIRSKTLYRGEEWKTRITDFIKLKQKFDTLNSGISINRFVWKHYRNACATLKNTSMGTLIEDLSKGTDLEAAVRKYEKMVAPENYRRTTALITPKMVEGAVDKLRELGLEDAVKRRHARLSDVSVNDVLFVDNEAAPHMKDGLTDLLMGETKRKPFDAKKAANIKIEDFVENVLPKAKTIDMIVAGRNQSNFMTVTAPAEDDTGRLLAWENDFGWSYDGDVADSLKERVKKAGGDVDADLRVSLGWYNADDLDLHCLPPRGAEIYFGNKAGILDVDMNAYSQINRVDPVENMRWKKMPEDGVYTFIVDNYTKRSNDNLGFELELECMGETRVFTFDRAVAHNMKCLKVTIKKGQVVKIEASKALTEGAASNGEKWGVPFNTPVPVDAMMLSPNHWGENASGQKHWFFMLRDCKNPEKVRGLFNEHLRGDLREHRKVFEVLGSKTMIEPADEQLSGIGFTAGRNDNVVAVVNGAAYNIQF